MKFTDLFIKRPVLASVISLLILLLGLRAIFAMPVRQYPYLTNTVITVTTNYPGASPDLIQAYIAVPLEKSIATADGIDYMTSNSIRGVSTIKCYIKLNYDPNTAFTDILSKVNAVRAQLPPQTQDPVLEKTTGTTISLMYIGFNSTEMTPGQITDYLTRVVVPKLQAISGLSQAQILGGKTFAMRVWLDPQKMAAKHVSPQDVFNTIQNNNFIAAGGATKGYFVSFNVIAGTTAMNQEQFNNLVIKNVGDTLVRLQDVGKVELGSQDYNSSVTFNGEQAVFIGITATPTANPLTVISAARAALPELIKQFPPSLKASVVYDATTYIRSSLREVIKTLVEATLIVIVVIYLFLGSLRSVAIPVVTIPLSLIGVASFMLALGYSINLLTLLAMVLAIGLVVDDAIVVVENIHRHLEEGMKPFAAAIQGAREIATPVIAMTLTLAAVYAPIGFLSGITGTLFREFAFTLASAVIVSGIIALTLSPMMCSKILSGEKKKARFELFLEVRFERLRHFYLRRLHSVLSYRPVTLLFAAVVLTSIFFLFQGTSSELAPDEDQGVLFVGATAPEYANLFYAERYTNEFNKIFKSLPETSSYFIVNNSSGSVTDEFAGDIFKPWGERKHSQAQLNEILQDKMNGVAGLQVAVFPLPTLPVGDQGFALQFVLQNVGSYSELYAAEQDMLKVAQNSGLFLFVDGSLRYNKPQLDITINREKAGQLGINMADIGNALSTAMSGNYINFFAMQGQSYQVIPQMLREFRLNPQDLGNIYVPNSAGTLLPLATIVDIGQSTQPNSLTQFQQLNSATIQGVPKPGVTLGDAVKFLQGQANQILPHGMTYDYGGQTRQYVEEGSALMFAFFFALIVIFLVLAAQFESFRDPFIVLISVPMSICGALIPLYLGAATINIYTEVGLITLIGLISKHGILMTDFANKLQINEGYNVREAIEHAASIRLRPILMTTAAMVVGVIPLILASGPGAVSRFDIGVVIATGMTIGTLFTLFVVPTMYTFLARDHAKAAKILESEDQVLKEE